MSRDLLPQYTHTLYLMLSSYTLVKGQMKRHAGYVKRHAGYVKRHAGYVKRHSPLSVEQDTLQHVCVCVRVLCL